MKYLCFLLLSVLITHSIAKPVDESELKNDYNPLDFSNQLVSADSENEDDDYDDSENSQLLIGIGGGEDLENEYPGGIKVGGIDALKKLRVLEGLEELEVLDDFDGELDDEARGPITLPLEDIDEIIVIEVIDFDEDQLDSEFLDSFDFNGLKK